jgi:hypothetical protein
VDASHCRGAPCLFIKLNGKDLYRANMDQGSSTVLLDIPNDFESTSVVEIGMTNKDAGDTVVDDLGNILQDKKILITGLEMDTVDVFQDANYFYHRLEYIEHGCQRTPAPGFFINDSSLKIRYQGTFWQHYLSSQQAPTWRINEEKRKQMPELVAELKSLINGLKY